MYSFRWNIKHIYNNLTRRLGRKMAGRGGSSKSLMGKFANGHCFAATTSMERLINWYMKRYGDKCWMVWPWFDLGLKIISVCFEDALKFDSERSQTYHASITKFDIVPWPWNLTWTQTDALPTLRAWTPQSKQSVRSVATYPSQQLIHDTFIPGKSLNSNFWWIQLNTNSELSAITLRLSSVQSTQSDGRYCKRPHRHSAPMDRDTKQWLQKHGLDVDLANWHTASLTPTPKGTHLCSKTGSSSMHVHVQNAKICTDNSQHCDLHWCPVIQSNLLQRLISLQETSPFNELTKLCCESITANTIYLSELTAPSQLNVIPQRQRQNHTLP